MRDVGPITIESDLTFRNAFLFPIQNASARRELLWGAVLLLLPGVGWLLNMGHRLGLVHRMLRRDTPWVGWRGTYQQSLWRGLLTTIVIAFFHVPAVVFIVFWSRTSNGAFLLAAAPILTLCLYVLPGFMTFYAVRFDPKVLISPRIAIVRVLGAGPLYFKAWLIGLTAVILSFGGLLAFGIGFLITSVWFWQVAAFSFANALSRQYNLINTSEK